jgi:hypothetical protein
MILGSRSSASKSIALLTLEATPQGVVALMEFLSPRKFCPKESQKSAIFPRLLPYDRVKPAQSSGLTQG